MSPFLHFVFHHFWDRSKHKQAHRSREETMVIQPVSEKTSFHGLYECIKEKKLSFQLLWLMPSVCHVWKEKNNWVYVSWGLRWFCQVLYNGRDLQYRAPPRGCAGEATVCSVSWKQVNIHWFVFIDWFIYPDIQQRRSATYTYHEIQNQNKMKQI